MNMNSYNCCASASKESKQIETLASLLKLVAEKNRLIILCLLRNGTHCVCELIKHVGVSQSLISHHLKDLKDAGIVIDHKKGLRVYYELTAKGKYLTRILFVLSEKEVNV
jgi:ArsR family transcriptional regulator, arsenate/arsenite/antimonite-responsive transcriptional repressor